MATIPPGLKPVASASPGGAVELRASFQRWRDLVKRNGKQLVQQTAAVLANEIHSGGKYSPGTPIATGFHRANWAAGINMVPVGVSVGEKLLANPNATLDQMVAKAQELEVGQTWIASNNGPAIGRLEFDQWSDQAPDGFVRPAARAIQQIVDEVGAHLESK